MNNHKPSIKPGSRLVMLAAAFLITTIAAWTHAATADTRAAIAAQSRAFMDGVARGDARTVAEIFTADAKLIIPGVEDVIAGREAIENFWQAGVSNGVKELRLSSTDLEGNGRLMIETGTYQALGAGGSDLGRGHYLFVWKKDGGTWRIHRDIASASASQAPAAAGAMPRTTDRVGFPRDYRSTLKPLDIIVKEDQVLAVMTALGNELATRPRPKGMASATYPYGTVIAMEFAHGVRDGEGQLLYDTGGAARTGEIARIDVMRRERGYGEVYGENRAGEWEFASYRPDGSTLIAPEDAVSCAACHRKAGPERDFVFGRYVPADQR